jgi:hypothetical protein
MKRHHRTAHQFKSRLRLGEVGAEEANSQLLQGAEKLQPKGHQDLLKRNNCQKNKMMTIKMKFKIKLKRRKFRRNRHLDARDQGLLSKSHQLHHLFNRRAKKMKRRKKLKNSPSLRAEGADELQHQLQRLSPQKLPRKVKKAQVAGEAKLLKKAQ